MYCCGIEYGSVAGGCSSGHSEASICELARATEVAVSETPLAGCSAAIGSVDGLGGALGVPREYAVCCSSAGGVSTGVNPGVALGIVA